METAGPRQRLRITFSRGDAVRHITHLDMLRLWERLVRRARLPVSYSSTEVPHPRLSLAAPLAVGVTSEGEILDLFLDACLPVVPLGRRIAMECPEGIVVGHIQEVGLAVPSLQSLVRFSEYRVALSAAMPIGEMKRRVSDLLAAASLPRERRREKEIRRYDLRPLIDNLWLAGWREDGIVLGMILQTDEEATGRPDEVLAALGVSEPAHSIHRIKLILAPPTAAEPARVYQRPRPAGRSRQQA